MDKARGWADEGQIQTAETLLDGLVAALTTIGGKKESQEPRAYTYFNLGRVLAQCERHLDAAAAFKRAHKIYDECEQSDRSMCRPCAANRALALARAEVDPEDIRREFAKELRVTLDKVKSSPPSALLSLGVLNFAAGLHPEAEAFWKEAMGRAADQEKQAKLAEQAKLGLEELVELEERAELERGELELAKRAEQARQEQAWAAIDLASLHIATNKLDIAEKDIESARSYWSGVTSTTTFGITEADLAIKRENWEEAQAQLDMVIHAEPDRARALYRMGVVAALRKDYDEAEKWLRKTISVAPWYAKAQADLGRVQLARDGGSRSDGLLRLPWAWRSVIAVLVAAVGLGIGLSVALCQPDRVDTTRTWGVAVTVTAVPGSSNAAETPEGQGAAPRALIAAITPVGRTGMLQGAKVNAEPTPTPSYTSETRHEVGFQDIPAGFLAVITLIIGIAAIVLFLPAVTSIKVAGIDVTPIQAPPARPFFAELDLGEGVEPPPG